MLGWLIGDLWPYLAAAAGAVAAIGMAWFSGKRAGKSGSENKALKDAEKRSEKGRKAVADMRDTDRPAWIERMRDNDKRWR